MYKPNLQLPLATSYQERGVAGFTNAITNRLDQQKINCFYELSKNAITGGGKLDLTKRPGVTIDAGTYGVSTQAAYLIGTNFISLTGDSPLFSPPIVFSTSGALITTSSSIATNTVYSTSSAEAWVPAYLDKTTISNAENIVLQIRKAGTYSTSILKTFFSSTPATWTEITDSDFSNNNFFGKMEHMDGFAFQLVSSSRIINSDLNSIANWTATGFISKLIKYDAPIGLMKLNNQLLAAGDETVEAFYNAGNATGSPLLPIKQLAQKIGLVHTAYIGGGHYYCTMENRIYFVGRRAGGLGSIGVFTYNGSIYEKISSSFIDKILNEQASSIYSVNSFGFNGHNAISISLTISTAATQRWLMYFPDWKDWFEWNSTTFSPVNNGEFYLGITPNQQKVYKFAVTDNWQDSGTSFTSSTQFKLPQDGHQRKRMAEFGVLADTARASNQLLVEFSDDDYQSFYTVGNIELQRDIKTLNRGGSYRQRAVRLSSTNALEMRLSAFIARVE